MGRSVQSVGRDKYRGKSVFVVRLRKESYLEVCFSSLGCLCDRGTSYPRGLQRRPGEETHTSSQKEET